MLQQDRIFRAHDGEREHTMGVDAKKHYGSGVALLVLGLLALYGRTRWLVLVIPVAALVWYLAALKLPAGRKIDSRVKIEDSYGAR
jgi:hypothetical protein